MKKSPLQTVKDRFGDDRKEAKAKLVAAVRELAEGGLWVDRTNEDKGLELVSNQKLLHLHDVLTQVKSSFGSRDALIDDIVKVENRTKDATYRKHFEEWPTPRLWDYHQAAKKRASA